MKRPLYVLLLALGAIASVPAFAQSSLFAQHILSSKVQQFNRPISPEPYIGMDLARTFFPVIIVQVSDQQASPVWSNEVKYTTNRALFNPDIFEALGYYTWQDTFGWIPQRACLFSINYNQTRKSVMMALEQRSLALQMTHVTTSYSFNTNNQVDSEKMILDGQVFHTKFEYNTAGKLITATQSKEGSDTWVNSYTYDQDNRLTEELLVRKKIILFEPEDAAGGQFNKSYLTVSDSITKERYQYGPGNKVTRKESYVYDQNLPGWKLTVINEYAYNQQGLLKEDHIQTLLNNVMTPAGNNYYSYTATGRPDTIISNYLDSSLQLQGYKVKIFYDALDSAAMAFQYALNGTEFETTHSRRWVFYDKTTGLNNVTGEVTLHIYPNPCKDVLNLPVEKGILKIQDMSGKEVHRISLSSPRVDVSFLQPGFYFVSIDDSKPVKMVKE